MLFKTLVILGVFACSQATPISSKSALHVSEATNQLGFNLYKQLAEKQGNVLVSPWSAQSVFALAYLGAEGNTAHEIATALQLQDDKQEAIHGFQEILEHWYTTKNSSVVLNSINKLYPALNTKVKPDYMWQAKTALNATVEPINLAESVAASRKINRWVEQNTDGKIKDIIQPDTLGPLTRLVLINALYFKGKWAYQFEKSTQEMNFYQHLSEVKRVPSMYLRAKLPYGHSEDLDAQIVELPYNDTDYSLVVIIPRAADGLANVEQKLPIKMNEILSEVHEMNVQLEMPKFNLSQKIDLVEEMQKLGIHDAFRTGANFKAMADGELFISNAVQKAYIEINEEGTTAAAATNVNVNIKSSGIMVTANRPFMFVLWKKSANVALLVGRVSEPSQLWNQI